MINGFWYCIFTVCFMSGAIFLASAIAFERAFYFPAVVFLGVSAYILLRKMAG